MIWLLWGRIHLDSWIQADQWIVGTIVERPIKGRRRWKNFHLMVKKLLSTHCCIFSVPIKYFVRPEFASTVPWNLNPDHRVSKNILPVSCLHALKCLLSVSYLHRFPVVREVSHHFCCLCYRCGLHKGSAGPPPRFQVQVHGCHSRKAMFQLTTPWWRATQDTWT